MKCLAREVEIDVERHVRGADVRGVSIGVLLLLRLGLLHRARREVNKLRPQFQRDMRRCAAPARQAVCAPLSRAPPQRLALPSTARSAGSRTMLRLTTPTASPAASALRCGTAPCGYVCVRLTRDRSASVLY